MRRFLAATVLCLLASILVTTSDAHAKSRKSLNVNPSSCSDPNGWYRCGGGDFTGRNWDLWPETRRKAHRVKVAAYHPAAKLKVRHKSKGLPMNGKVVKGEHPASLADLKTPFGVTLKVSTSLAGFPLELVAKTAEIVNACGSRIVSAYRPGARVRGSGAVSNHALKKAVDVAGNPSCIYAKLKGWPGGYSTDYYTAPGGQHVHISYNRSKEWGRRFVHYHGGGHKHRRYAKRHRHYASAW